MNCEITGPSAYNHTRDSSPWPGLSFRGGKFLLEKSRGTKYESLFDTSLYHNQVTKTKVDLNQTFRRFLPGYKDKATKTTIKNCKKILRGGGY